MILNGCFERFENTGVIISNALKIFQDDFLPLFRNADVVSEPVKAWKNRRTLVLVSPRLLYKSLTFKYTNHFPHKALRVFQGPPRGFNRGK